jgi:hypothetical protein
MTAQRPRRHVAPVQDSSAGQLVPPGTDSTGAWPAGAKRWLVAGGAAAASGVPAAVFTLTSRTAAQPVLVTVVVLATIVFVSSVAAVIYQARQETLRKRMELHAVTTVADALAACIDDLHRHADDPADKASVAEARRVRDSARQYVTEHGTEVLDRLTERPKP